MTEFSARFFFLRLITQNLSTRYYFSAVKKNPYKRRYEIVLCGKIKTRRYTPEPRIRTFSKEKSTDMGDFDSRISNKEDLKTENWPLFEPNSSSKPKKISPSDAQVCEPFHLHSLVAICCHWVGLQNNRKTYSFSKKIWAVFHRSLTVLNFLNHKLSKLNES